MQKTIPVGCYLDGKLLFVFYLVFFVFVCVFAFVELFVASSRELR